MWDWLLSLLFKIRSARDEDFLEKYYEGLDPNNYNKIDED